jgi:hypothetical protein
MVNRYRQEPAGRAPHAFGSTMADLERRASLLVQARYPRPVIWVSTSSHRSRERLGYATREHQGPEFGIWPARGMPRGAYYCVPRRYAEAIERIPGARILRGRPSGGRVFRRWA